MTSSPAGKTLIYCVEDDSGIRNMLVYALNQAGYTAEGFRSAPEFWQAMEKATPDLILLDIMLPQEDGLSILRRLRADSRFALMPIIMLTAKGTELDKTLGLDAGADDYIAKPFGIMELMARIRAALRRSRGAFMLRERKIIDGAIELDSDRHQVTVDGEPITLTLKEFGLLELFLTHVGMVLTRDQILQNVWGYDYDGGTRTVDMHITSLRSKLGTSGQRIETIRGLGYRFNEEK
ncbi:MAG: response regulator transcription factor [Clostridiaceae bacterium]|nr:response regulator transcription factor [Clostridiaceae bacterium]